MYTEASHILSVREIVICCNFVKDEWSLSFECYVFQSSLHFNHRFELCVGLEIQV